MGPWSCPLGLKVGGHRVPVGDNKVHEVAWVGTAVDWQSHTHLMDICQAYGFTRETERCLHQPSYFLFTPT